MTEQELPEAIKLENEAEALKAEGKQEEAIAKYEAAIEADPGFARAHMGLSVLYYKLNQPEASVKHAEKAVELEPEDKFNYTALSVTYQRAFELTQDPKYIQLAEEAKAKSHMM